MTLPRSILLITSVVLITAGCGDPAEKARTTPGEPDVDYALQDLTMVTIPGGTFDMGDLGWALGPVHTVTVRPFKLGKHEVTFAQWDACVADGGCNGYSPDDEGWGRGNRPVINVSWDDVQGFIQWLNSRTGGDYRLPSEAEWEYAARAGSRTKYSWGDEIVSNRANCDGCGSQWDGDRTAPVGSFPANAWGLHDTHGNVWEWVEDCADFERTPGGVDMYIEIMDNSPIVSLSTFADMTDSSPSPTDMRNCADRVVRGGSWGVVPWSLGSAQRFYAFSEGRGSVTGFRLAQDN